MAIVLLLSIHAESSKFFAKLFVRPLLLGYAYRLTLTTVAASICTVECLLGIILGII
jgi:hypothetical protein